MAIKMNQGLKQTQSLMITPQLQQAIKLLTLTHLEMTTLISQEMVENPMLEEIDGEMEVTSSSESSEDIEAREATAENFSGPELIEGSRDTFDWESYSESFNSSSSAPNVKENFSSEDAPNYENMVSRGQSLQEHLEWQLRMENLSSQELDLAMEILGNINDEGYLDLSFEEILANFPKMDKDQALGVLGLIQHLDPVGCGSHTLEECLGVQARMMPERSPLAELIIQRHLKDLEKKDYNKIAKELGVTKEKVKEAELIIMSLNPKPGRLVSSDEIQYIVPDIFVAEVGGEFVVQVNDEGVPRLRVSNLYRSLIKSSESDAEAKEFVQDKLRSALWLIKSIENRQKTIYKVAESIVRTQQEFFKKGPAYLKPMILKDIANEIGMHESTVSRVTTNKYMHTPIGTFELKYFFNAGIGGKNGGIDIAGETLKLKIKELIANEDPKRPLSDQKISELLSTKDIVVARRTVAKYREMMGVPPSSKRKK
ncbi:MAG TPA: RNA polymerase factor sigma-54 [Bacteriovoracaceae bacterium]|nr:RNA polymerase factor sigma-54 [Bacteriovoracaceae bacterium]